MKTKTACLVIASSIIVLLTIRGYSQTYVNGDVKGVWAKENSPYLVTGDITVQANKSLVIKPGVQIRFQGKYKFVVYGVLKAIGTSENYILFTRDQEIDGHKWRGLGFKDAIEASELKYCIFEFIDQQEVLFFPYEWKGCIHAEYSDLTINNCIVRNNYGNWAAIYIYRSSNSDYIISYNLVENNHGNGIHVTECESVTIRNNTAIRSTNNGICCSKLSTRGVIINNILYENNIGIGGHGGGTFYIGFNSLWNNVVKYDFKEQFSPIFEIPMGTGDVLADPLFIGGEPFDYHLQENSPCIDAGDPNSPLDPDGTRADMGAYPYSDEPIPVELSGFEVYFHEDMVVLEWKTWSESANLGFEVQKRTSLNEDFSKIGFVKGQGTTNNLHFYTFEDTEITQGTCYYRLKQIDFNGSFELSRIVQITIDVPNRYSLFQNYPNPFNPTTTISFDIPKRTFVKLSVLDVLGKEIETIMNRECEAGQHQVLFDAKNLTSGLYFYRLEAGGFSEVRKFVVLK